MNLSEHSGYVHDEITRHLGLNFPEGIYAGSAISSIVLSKLWNRQIEIVDLFERYLDYPDQVDEEARYVFRFTSHTYSEPSKCCSGYTIISSIQNGKIITRRYFKNDMVLGEKERTLNLLKGLGLNALQVAFYSDGKGAGSLHATKEFLTFVSTRQLRVTCPVIGRTFVDLAKFQDIYDSYVDWDEEALLMSGYRQMFGSYMNAYDDELVIADKLLIDRYRDRLRTFCSVDELDQMVLPGCEDAFHASWEIDFFQSKESSAVQDQIRLVSNFSPYSLTSYTFTYIFDQFLRKSTKKTHKKRFWMALENPTAAKFVMDDSKFVRSDFSSKHLKELAMFESCHPKAMKVIAEVSHDFISIVRVIRLMKKLGRVHGNPDFVIGLLEHSQSYGKRFEEITEQSLTELIDNYCSIGDSKLIDAADLSQFKHKDAITELTSSDALILEGIRCSNCIGGYARHVEKFAGNVRIFHVHTKDDNQHATAAIYYNLTGKNVVDYELFGPKNTAPTKNHKKLTNALAVYLKNTIWKSEITVEEQSIDFDIDDMEPENE